MCLVLNFLLKLLNNIPWKDPFVSISCWTPPPTPSPLVVKAFSKSLLVFCSLPCWKLYKNRTFLLENDTINSLHCCFLCDSKNVLSLCCCPWIWAQHEIWTGVELFNLWWEFGRGNINLSTLRWVGIAQQIHCGTRGMVTCLWKDGQLFNMKNCDCFAPCKIYFSFLLLAIVDQNWCFFALAHHALYEKTCLMNRKVYFHENLEYFLPLNKAPWNLLKSSSSIENWVRWYNLHRTLATNELDQAQKWVYLAGRGCSGK